MERIKRQQNDIVQVYNGNKKRKLQDENNNTNKSVFEILPNEIIYEIFRYLDIYHIYDGFFDLNKRFKNLYKNSNFPIQINISTMTKTNFERYYIKVILPNRLRINILRLSNPFTVDIIFSPSRIITQFSQLETLILDNINSKSFDKISTYLMFLPKLHSLIVNFAEYIQCPSILFGNIFHLPKLKYSKITYRLKDQYRPFPIHFTQYDRSHIEYLVINTRFPFETFNDLLSCLPKLRHISINCLVNSNYLGMETENEVDPIVLKHLKYVSLKFDSIRFNQLEDIIQKFFRRVEVLRLTTKYDESHLDAKRWEQLISTYMPNLRIFDINHYGIVQNNFLTYHDLINQFNSSFWIERQWFFRHQHNWRGRLDSGIFYSTDPYRRKDYGFYWEIDANLCSHLQETNLNSVKHVHIHSKQTITNCINYFPNAIELTIEHYFKTTGDSIPKTLNHILPLQKITKLVIECSDFPFEQIIKLIRFTPNLHNLKFSLSSFYEINSNLIQQNQIFQYVSNTNKIKNLDLRSDCTLERIQLIVSLFPKLEYLKTGMKKEEINQIVHFLLSKNNIQTRYLFFLCISEIPKRCLKELNILIQSKKLLVDYFIKFVNRDLYLWW